MTRLRPVHPLPQTPTPSSLVVLRSGLGLCLALWSGSRSWSVKRAVQSVRMTRTVKRTWEWDLGASYCCLRKGSDPDWRETRSESSFPLSENPEPVPGPSEAWDLGETPRYRATGSSALLPGGSRRVGTLGPPLTPEDSQTPPTSKYLYQRKNKKGYQDPLFLRRILGVKYLLFCLCKQGICP